MRSCKHCHKDISHRNYQAQYCDDVCKARFNCSKYYARHSEQIKQTRKEHFKQNKEKYAAKCAKRYADKTQSTPAWLTEFDLFYINEFYHLASLRKLQVDHIIPLRGKNVCGLHTPSNLQLLSPEENRKKSNKHVE